MTLSISEFRVSARSLGKQPVFTTVVVLSLALAIALNTTMYGVLDAMIHPVLDVRDPTRLFWIQYYGDPKSRVDNNQRDAALATGMHTYDAITRGGGGTPYALIERGQNFAEGSVAAVGPNYFDVVGPRVIAGRTFAPGDVESAQRPIVITDVLAEILFPTGEPPVGGRIEIDRETHLVVGVVSQHSNFPHYREMAWTIAPPAPPRGGYSRLIRLRAGATQADAERELQVIAARFAAISGESPRDVAFRFHAAADPDFQVVGLHFALMFAVGAVLLVACANLANLQMARGISRRRDLALRSALGASRKRLVGYLLTESIILVVSGLVCGLLLCFVAARLLAAYIPPSMGQFVVEPHISWRVLAFAILATVVILCLIGVAPSIYVSRADPNMLLKAGAGTGATRANRQRYGVLVAVEIALALALSSAAVLTVRNAVQASQTWYGYDPRLVVTGLMSITASPGTTLRYSDLFARIANRLRSVDGVVDASAMKFIYASGGAVTVEDPGGLREVPNAPAITMVSPSYLRTLGLPIVQGRDFLDGERDAGVVVVDEPTARIFWPNAKPVGAQIKAGDKKSSAPFVRVVGVVGEQPGFRSASVPGALMFGLRRFGQTYYVPGPTDTTVEMKNLEYVQFIARAKSHPEQLPISLRRASAGWGDMHIRWAGSMDQSLGLLNARQSSRFISSLFTLFAALGVGLAAFGVYGVVDHSVVERRRELGVRIALGAGIREILHAVLRESAIVALVGIALGLLITKYAVQHLDKIIIEDDMFNALLFGAVALVLVAVSSVAAMIPAMRATRVDPTESLRSE